MKKKSTDYSTADAGGWRNACDDLFLAQFRGRPCEICGKKFHMGQRSCGHHLAEKGMHRKYRYDESMIIVLCTGHHSKFARDMSPHAEDTAANSRFYKWLEDNRPEQHAKLQAVDGKPFDKSWTYREMYEMLGGEIGSKSGLMKDMRPKNHAKKVREAESLMEGQQND